MAEPFCMAHVAAKTVLTYSEMSLSLNTEVPKMPEAAGPRTPQTPESPLLGGSWELVRKDIRTFTRIISRVTLFIAELLSPMILQVHSQGIYLVDDGAASCAARFPSLE